MKNESTRSQKNAADRKMI